MDLFQPSYFTTQESDVVAVAVVVTVVVVVVIVASIHVFAVIYAKEMVRWHFSR